VDSAQFGSSEHNREEHRTIEANDEITEVSPTKFSLSPRSKPKDTAIRVQHPGGDHMINNIRLVAR
jgi:hypothetical protein